MVRVSAETDFSVRHDDFIAFTKQLAIQAYIHSETNWKRLAEKAPELAAAFEALRASMKEKIEVSNIAVFVSPDQQAEMEAEGKHVFTAAFE